MWHACNVNVALLRHAQHASAMRSMRTHLITCLMRSRRSTIVTGYRHASVTLPSHYRHITVALPLHYRRITVTLPSHYRCITVALPSHYHPQISMNATPRRRQLFAPDEPSWAAGKEYSRVPVTVLTGAHQSRAH